MRGDRWIGDTEECRGWGGGMVIFATRRATKAVSGVSVVSQEQEMRETTEGLIDERER